MNCFVHNFKINCWCLGMLACVSKEDFIDFNLRIIESSMLMMRKSSIAIQKPVSQHVFIIDMDGFTLKVVSSVL